MNKVHQLIAETGKSRSNYISIIKHLSQENASFKKAEDVWSIVDITEHLFWAEQGGYFRNVENPSCNQRR